MAVVSWTTASNRDWFERNILAGYVPSAPADPFRSNALAWTWPTPNDLADWMKQSGVAVDTTTKVPALELALASAISRIAERTCFHVRPVDANGDVDPAGDAVEIPPEIHLATLMTAHRWYRRPSSPDGVMGANELAGVIRINGYDPDVEALLSNYDSPGLA